MEDRFPCARKTTPVGAQRIAPAKAEPILAKIMEARQIPQDGAGPWIELIGKAGDQALLTRLHEEVTTQRLNEDAALRALDALMEASRLRNLRPKADLSATALPLLTTAKGALQLKLAHALGAWKEKKAIPTLLQLVESDSAELSTTASQALVEIGGGDVKKAIADLAKRRAEGDTGHVFENAVQALAQMAPQEAAPYLSKLFAGQTDKDNSRATAIWRDLLKIKGGRIWATLIPPISPQMRQLQVCAPPASKENADRSWRPAFCPSWPA